MRAAAVIGDLSNPFHREERQRDAWNEASAVGLQVLLALSFLAAYTLGNVPTTTAVFGAAVRRRRCSPERITAGSSSMGSPAIREGRRAPAATPR